MKKITALVLLSTLYAATAMADEASMKDHSKESAGSKAVKHEHKIVDKKGLKDEECDTKHNMKASHSLGLSDEECDTKHNMNAHHAHGMMDEHGAMMGGHGAGMMGGHEPGMMGGHEMSMMLEPDMHMLGALALSDEQQTKVKKFSAELKHNNWATQGLLNDETEKLRDLYQADKRDPAAIGKEYQKVFDLKRQMIEAYLETENRIEEILSVEQRAQMKEARNRVRGMMEHPQF